MVSVPADALTELTAEWLRGNLRAPRPAPLHTQLTCMVPDCTGMSFVLLPAEKQSGNVCFRHYQVILKATGKRS